MNATSMPIPCFSLEADYDVRDINQTFTQINDAFYPNFKGYADLRHDGRLGDMPLKSYVGFFANNMEQESQTFENLGDFRGTRGTLVQNSRGTIRNIGGRVAGGIGVHPEVDPGGRCRLPTVADQRADDQLHGRRARLDARRGSHLL
jgi:hypothetical protein